MTAPSNNQPVEKRRVLYIDHTLYKSGAATSLGTLIRSLSSRVDPYFILRAGNDVREMIGAIEEPVYYERFMPQFMTALCSPQYPPHLFLWHLCKIPLAFIRVFAIARAWNIQLIHLNDTVLLPYVFIGRSLGLPVVMHARGATAPRPVERYFLNKMGSFKKMAVIAIDEEVKRSLPDRCRDVTRIIYNPIDLGHDPTEKQIEAIRRSWGCTPEDVVVGQVASLHTSKGIWDILEIALELCPRNDRLKFVLIGDDRAEVGEGPELRRLIQHKKFEGKVILPGYLSDTSLIYGALDIALCFFGRYLGGVGRQAYEAAMAGKPLIATMPNPEKSQTIKHGITGLAFKPNDRRGILEALLRLTESTEERGALGRRAMKEIGHRHQPVRIADEVYGLYESLL